MERFHWRIFWATVVAVILLAFVPMVAGAQDVGDGSTTPLDSMSDYALWAIIGGFVTTWVTELINRNHWHPGVKYGMFFVLCCVTAALDAWYTRTLNFDDWSRALLFVFASGITTYLAGKKAINAVGAKTG